jgi:hypothetical protein
MDLNPNRTEPPSAAEIREFHTYGPEITVSDSDGNVYEQTLCQCGEGLGMHLSLPKHVAYELMKAGHITPAITYNATSAGERALYFDDMSNGAGATVPEIADACETVVRKILTAAAPHMFAEILALMEDPEHYDSQGPSEGYVSVENLRKAIEGVR